MFHAKSNYHVAPRIFGGLENFFNNNGWSQLLADEKMDVYSVPVNIHENDKGYDMQLVAPGLKKEDFKINLEKNVLSVSFEQKQEQKEEGNKVLRSEYSFRSFKRSFTLNDKINTAGISAKYEDGILNINLPKKETTETVAQEITVA